MKIKEALLSSSTLKTQVSIWYLLVFFALIVLCAFKVLSDPLALLAGLILAQISKNPFLGLNHKLTSFLLKFSVIGLGFGMNVTSALNASKQGMWITVGSIVATFCLGFILYKVLGLDKKTSLLISSGTAICGGSAIAAVSPVLGAKEKQISVALGVVFILNSVALFVFPVVGTFFNMSQNQFGVWSAIAIHDTSSVVGAAAKYGEKALEIATTVKLARALWIIPVSIIVALFSKTGKKGVKIPYFIGLFILAILANTYVSQLHTITPYITEFAKSGLLVTLFLIGTGLSFSSLKQVGYRPLLQGVVLWVAIASATLWVVLLFIH
ncbi:YeiH family protein [Neptunitalea lumnitzerae]|nr:putative sulfate exporter family transporter [Neptunitalea sp. Y10]